VSQWHQNDSQHTPLAAKEMTFLLNRCGMQLMTSTEPDLGRGCRRSRIRPPIGQADSFALLTNAQTLPPVSFALLPRMGMWLALASVVAALAGTASAFFFCTRPCHHLA
jgi:hypothetical protein